MRLPSFEAKQEGACCSLQVCRSPLSYFGKENFGHHSKAPLWSGLRHKSLQLCWHGSKNNLINRIGKGLDLSEVFEELLLVRFGAAKNEMIQQGSKSVTMISEHRGVV